MEIAIYLLIGLIVQAIYRLKIDKIGHEPNWTVIALPELWIVRLAIWPLYLVNLVVIILSRRKDSPALEK